MEQNRLTALHMVLAGKQHIAKDRLAAGLFSL